MESSVGAMESPFVDAAWIADRLEQPDVRIVEVDVSPANYNAGHIPGAVLWNTYSDLRHSDYSPMTAEEFQAVLSASGVEPDTTVVFYGYAPHLGFWLMKSIGHDRVRLLDGSRDQWPVAGYSWSTDVPSHTASHYPSIPTASPLRSDVEDVKQGLGDKGVVFVDTRSQAEYDGERFWPSGAPASGRPGRIPGAVHVHIDLLRGEDGQFKPANEIDEILRSRGVTPASRVITYCTIANRASQAWFAMTHLLGYPDCSVYYGSWAEWGSRADTPVE